MKEHDKKKIVFANGIFDLLHPGHIELLKFAKSLGEKLVVGINSDRSTKILKGSSRPVHCEHYRKIVLENLSFVDEVIIFDDLKPTKTVCDLMPHVVVKGGDTTSDNVRKVDKIPSEVKIVIFPVVNDSNKVKISTTATIEKMQK